MRTGGRSGFQTGTFVPIREKARKPELFRRNSCYFSGRPRRKSLVCRRLWTGPEQPQIPLRTRGSPTASCLSTLGERASLEAHERTALADPLAAHSASLTLSIGCFGFELEEACNDLGIGANVYAAASARPSLSHFGTRRRAPNAKSRQFAKKTTNHFRALPETAAPSVWPTLLPPIHAAPFPAYTQEPLQVADNEQLAWPQPHADGSALTFPGSYLRGLCSALLASIERLVFTPFPCAPAPA